MVMLSYGSLQAQDDIQSEIDDNSGVPAKQYFIGGEKVTFSSDPTNDEFSMLGVWEAKEGELHKLQFTDPETVLVSFGDKQVKGNWFIKDGNLSIQFKQNGSEDMPHNVSGTIDKRTKEMRLVITGYGSFIKRN